MCRSPAGQLFFKHFGENIFRNDLCNADVDLGDLLIHEGPAEEAQHHAAQVFGADRTYFVLNGTSSSNKVVTGALLRRGDLVLFDRNNHKSLHQGALVQAVILHNAGYRDVWEWGDRALLRAFLWLHAEAGYPASGDDGWEPWLVNHHYGVRLPAPDPARPGKIAGWTDWSHRAVVPMASERPLRAAADGGRAQDATAGFGQP